MIALLLVLAACGTGTPSPDPAGQALAPWPDDPTALLARCATEPFPELATTCRVQAAARLATLGKVDQADATCARVPEGTWRQECHFRVGEELSQAGDVAQAAAQCGQAGWFAQRCITHAAWRMRRSGEVNPRSPDPALEGDRELLLAAVQAGLAAHADPGVAGEGRDVFQAAWGRTLYRGSGHADPRAAHTTAERGPALRTGWAVEAARIEMSAPRTTTRTDPVNLVATLRSAWRQGTVLSGAPDPSPPPERYAPLQIGPQDQGVPHLPLYGGGLRLVGETVDEDADIAILEAVYGWPELGAAPFEAWLADPRPRVRWTAARLLPLAARESHGGDPDGGRARLDRALSAARDPVLRRLLAAQAPRPGPPP